MITGRALASMRTAQESALDQTIEIMRADAEADGYGGVTRNWRTVYLNVSARMMLARSGRETPGASRETSVQDYALTMAHDQDIMLGDRARIDGSDYEVVATNSGQQWRTATRAVVRLIR